MESERSEDAYNVVNCPRMRRYENGGHVVTGFSSSGNEPAGSFPMTRRRPVAIMLLAACFLALGIACSAAAQEAALASGVSGTVIRPVEVKRVRPVCRGAGDGASAMFEAVVDKGGGVRDVKLIEGERSALTDAAMAALIQWRYLPTRLNGTPVDAIWNYQLSGCLLTAFDVGTAASGQLSPNEPYFQWGACPFEGCVYRKWTALKDVVARRGRSRASAPTIVIGKGQSVVAVTGVVITTTVGKLRATADLELGSALPHVLVRKGDIFYVLSYLGESSYAFWYRGRIYVDHQYLEATADRGRPIAHGAVQLIQPALWDWWSWVETNDGRGGWVHGNDGFDGSDQYGG
jgi:hypothetical protein